MSESRSGPDDRTRVSNSPIDELFPGAVSEVGSAFTVGFRGYDRDEVDQAFAKLHDQVRKLQSDLDSTVAGAGARNEELQTELDQLKSRFRSTEKLQTDLETKSAQLLEAEEQIQALSAQMLEGSGEGEGDQLATRAHFESVLKVAEEQANVLLQNASTQAKRLLDAARAEVAAQKARSEEDIARLTQQAQHDADQVKLKIDTEYTAHQATIEREVAHAEEKVHQAEREAEAIRTEADKGAAALRALVNQEVSELRTDAERDVREMNARVLEFEESLTRRQDEAQQEFLVLHNQAVAHAERITADANEQVAASLEHSKRLGVIADDYEKMKRAQAAQVETEADVRARETVDRAQQKARKIVDMVTEHTNTVLRDAEDRTRQLRWQQQQLNSFMAEVRELIRPEGILAPVEGDGDEAAGDPDGVKLVADGDQETSAEDSQGASSPDAGDQEAPEDQ